MTNKAIVGRKVGMTQIWDDENRIVPVTVLSVAPMRVVQIKRPDTDGYSALQVTFGEVKASKLSKPAAGHFDKAGVAPGEKLVELRLDDVSEYEVGQEISVGTVGTPGTPAEDGEGGEEGEEGSAGDEGTPGESLFADGDKIDVTAVSRGKGFAGAMKRHNFAGQRASHGAHKVHRKPGAVGQCATPARIFKGKKMPGRMGGDKVTTLNLEVVKTDAARDLLLVKGAVPGPKGGTVVVRDAIKGGS